MDKYWRVLIRFESILRMMERSINFSSFHPSWIFETVSKESGGETIERQYKESFVVKRGRRGERGEKKEFQQMNFNLVTVKISG